MRLVGDEYRPRNPAQVVFVRLAAVEKDDLGFRFVKRLRVSDRCFPNLRFRFSEQIGVGLHDPRTNGN